MRPLLVMTAADLRQRVRDRTVLIFGLLVPLGMMLVFNLVFGGNDDVELQDVTVAVSAPERDELAAVVVDALRSVDAFGVRLEQSTAAEVPKRAESGDVDLGVVVPGDFGAAMRAGEATTVVITEGDGAGLETDILVSVVDGVVAQLDASAETARAGGIAGLPPEELEQLARQAATAGSRVELTEGRAATEQLSTGGALVAGQAGLFLLFTVGFGVLALLAEREQGTLARLQSMPMRSGLIVLGKALSGFLLGVVATTVLLVAGSFLFDVDFGSLPAIGVLILSAVAAATSLTLIVARVARTAEQANVAQSILAMLLGVAGGAFFPLSAGGLFGHLLDLNPVAALGRGLGITSGGGGLADIAVPVVTMLGFAVVCAAVSRLVPDRSGTT